MHRQDLVCCAGGSRVFQGKVGGGSEHTVWRSEECAEKWREAGLPSALRGSKVEECNAKKK